MVHVIIERYDMNINAISNVSFNGIKKHAEKPAAKKVDNGIFEQNEAGKWGIWTRDDGAYAFFTPISQITILENDENGQLGVYTRNGEDVFFTPLSDLKQDHLRLSPTLAELDTLSALSAYSIKDNHRETPQQYEKRKKESTEWCM